MRKFPPSMLLFAALLGLANPQLVSADPGAQVASVKSMSGSATGTLPAQRATPLATRARLEDGESVTIAAGSTIELLYLADGHREEIAGPCTVRVGKDGSKLLFGRSFKLVRVVGNHRISMLPNSGNDQTVGGSLAGHLDPYISPAKLVASRGVSVGDGEPDYDFADMQPHMDLDRGQWQLILPKDDVPAGFKLQLTGPELAVDIPITPGGQPFALPVPLKPGLHYAIVVSVKGQKLREIPFMQPRPDEVPQLEAMLNGDEKDLDAQVIAMGDLEAKGYPYLAVAKAQKIWARATDKGEKIGLQAFLYRMYHDVFKDAAMATEVRLAARASGYDL